MPFTSPATAGQVDLRALPESFPVPHVESRLAFDYDVTGQFASSFVDAHAVFAASEFLGATRGRRYDRIGEYLSETVSIQR